MTNLATVAHKTKECLCHIIIMHMLNVMLKRIKTGSTDVIMEDTHMKEKYETKNDELLFKAENLTGSSTKVMIACLNYVRG